jgi:hypothetical protein
MQETTDDRLVTSTFNPISQRASIEPNDIADSNERDLTIANPPLNRRLRYN